MREFRVLFVVGLLLCLCLVSFVSATQEIIGNTEAGSGQWTMSGNRLTGFNVSDTVPAGTWYVQSVWVYVHNHTTVSGVDGAAKAVLFNTTNGVVDVSEAVTINVAAPTWVQLNMTGNYTIEDYYRVGIVTSSGHDIQLHQISGSDHSFFSDVSNSFVSPLNVSDAADTSGNGPSMYVVLDSTSGGGTPAPTVTPTVTSGGTFTDNSAINALLSQLFWWLAALIIVLGPAFIFGVLFKGGTWGFLIGMLCGAGLGYWLMPTIVPLWLVIGVVFAVAAMAWSVFGRSS